MNSYYTLRAPTKTGNGGNWYRLLKLKEDSGELINLEPTLDTQSGGENGYLEWDVPDNTHNRIMLRKYRPTFIEVKMAESSIKSKKIVFKKASPDDEVDVEEKYLSGAKLNPNEIKKFKDKIREELTEGGVEVSVSSTLKELHAAVTSMRDENK